MTSLAKKAIFHLHRYKVERGWPRRETDAANAGLVAETHTKLGEIYALLRTCAEREAWQDRDASVPSAAMLRYERFLGGALEELIEAHSFLYFLEHRTLLPLAVVQDAVRDNAGGMVGVAH